jgi:chaperone modulatory protein CbpM
MTSDNPNAMEAGGLRLTALILEEQTELTLADLCRACAADTGLIVEMVDEGVLTPEGEIPTQWRFSGLHLQHARVALRLQRDLGVNLQGAALVLQLLEEMDMLRARLRGMAADS